MGISVQLGVLPYCTICEQYYTNKQLTQNMHKVDLLTLEWLIKIVLQPTCPRRKNLRRLICVALLASKTLFWHLPDQTRQHEVLLFFPQVLTCLKSVRVNNFALVIFGICWKICRNIRFCRQIP